MIHSMSGGLLSTHNKHDYVKVKMLDGEKKGENLWFVSELFSLKVGDKVLVQSLKDGENQGEVLRIDKNVDELSFPIPYKKMKKIIKILD